MTILVYFDMMIFWLSYIPDQICCYSSASTLFEQIMVKNKAHLR